MLKFLLYSILIHCSLIFLYPKVSEKIYTRIPIHLNLRIIEYTKEASILSNKKKEEISLESFNFSGVLGKFSIDQNTVSGTEKNNLLGYLYQEVFKFENSLIGENDSVFVCNIDIGGEQKISITGVDFRGVLLKQKTLTALKSLPKSIWPKDRSRLKIIISYKRIPSPKPLYMFSSKNNVVFQITKYGKGNGAVNKTMYYGGELLKFITNPIFYFLQ